jgi:DNA (cytosine-5)-methyltransferase 1
VKITIEINLSQLRQILNPHRAIDLFSGAGGWDLAARQLGIRADGVEIMPEARATRKVAGLRTVWDDVWTVTTSTLHQYQGQIASPPCPTFSQAGNGSGRAHLDVVLRIIPRVRHMSLMELKATAATMDDDERTAMVLTPLWYALHGDPHWLAWEQVPTVLPVWQVCAEELRADGWNVWTGYLHSEQYGTPQTRKRAFLLASKDREVSMPVPTHSKYHSHDRTRLDPGVKKWVSMAEALQMSPEGRMVSNYGTGGDPRNRGTRPLSEPAPTVASKINRNKIVGMGDTRASRGTLRWIDEPAPTITGSMDNGNYSWIPKPAIEGEDPEDCATPGYRKAGPPRGRTPGSVQVSVAEAGVLQDFPADYPWQGNEGKRYLQAGNAVPVAMARAALAMAVGVPP